MLKYLHKNPRLMVRSAPKLRDGENLLFKRFLGCLLITGMVLLAACREESFSPGQADSFIKFFGQYRIDEGFDVKTLGDGSYAVAGTTFASSVRKIILIRTDKYGNELWEPKIFGEQYDNTVSCLKLLSDGGFAILGTTLIEENDRTLVERMYLIRTDQNGNVLWTRKYGGNSSDKGYDLAETRDGGFILIGSTENLMTGELDVLLVKTDSEGTIEWTRTHGGAGDDVGRSVRETSYGYIYTGYTNSFIQPGQANYNIFIVKTNPRGIITHPATLGGTGDDFGESVIPHPQGGYVVLGTTTDPSTGIKNVFLARLEEDISRTVWTRQFGEQINHVANSFKITGEGSIAITGTQELSAVNHAIFLLKTDASGNEEFMKIFGGSGFQRGNAIDLTGDGGFVIAGSNELGGNSMITLIKTRADGGL